MNNRQGQQDAQRGKEVKKSNERTLKIEQTLTEATSQSQAQERDKIPAFTIAHAGDSGQDRNFGRGLENDPGHGMPRGKKLYTCHKVNKD